MKQLFACLALALAAGAASAVDAAGLERTHGEALEAVARSADKAWNERDAQGMAAHYNDAATASIGSVFLTGKAAILDYFSKSFGRLPAGMTHRTEVRRVVRIGELYAADTAVFLEVPDGEQGKRVVREFFTVTLLRPTDKGWEFMAVRSMPLAR
ncbi:MAG: hypothetical protein K0R43_897 [Pseudoduganella sp.]|jgi:uncharacterized protein (TIGR02246 family)|nr:hypothetical protein [Pseudoduganella sp.]